MSAYGAELILVLIVLYHRSYSQLQVPAAEGGVVLARKIALQMQDEGKG